MTGATVSKTLLRRPFYMETAFLASVLNCVFSVSAMSLCLIDEDKNRKFSKMQILK